MNRNICILISVCLTCIVVISTSFGFLYIHDSIHNKRIKVSSKLGTMEDITGENAGAGDLKYIIHENQKFVVCIECETANGKVSGSGFLYNELGDVITNAHVVEGAKEIYVKLADTSVFKGTLIGIGNDVDVALIRVPELAGKTPMKISKDRMVDVGDEVVALGSPLGLQNTATTGIISGMQRDFTMGRYKYHGVYQISAPISRGSSGGPLIDRKTGEVIGINSAGMDEGSIGFSIPIEKVAALVDGWVKNPSTEVVSTENDYSKKMYGISFIDSAKYLVTYFYDSLNSGDYTTAYALLGSSWQSNITYDNFRKGYINTLSVEVYDISAEKTSDDTVEITAKVSAVERLDGGKKQKVRYEVKYSIGFENGRIKILDGRGKKI